MSRARWICPVLLLVALHARAEDRALPSTDQRYEIEASLDPSQHVVLGHQRIHFTNHSPRALTVLYLHLYLNAFRDQKTVFMREAGAQVRSGQLGRPGRIDLISMRLRDGRDLLAKTETELVAGDHTQARVTLPEALAPGASLDLAIEFRSVLPELMARAGFADEFHMVAQWFPKLARLEESGQWVSFPYHGLGEFYADFADYTLQLRVPERYVVGATGRLVQSHAEASVRVDTFVAHAVLDVAFAAYPYFERRTFQVGQVQITMLAPRGYGAALRRQARILRAGLAYYGQRFGAYPYPSLTVIVPPRAAYEASGMEYPALIVTGGPWWALPDALPDVAHDFVTAHELAHQWFSVLLASNEVLYPMLDEGLAEWASWELVRTLSRAPPSVFASFDRAFDFVGLSRLLLPRGREAPPSSLLSVERYRPETLANAVYIRPALVLDALNRPPNTERFAQALRVYTAEQRFRHPTSAALFAAFDAAYDRGFSQRVLLPALSGKSDDTLLAPSAPISSFFADALFAAQALLHLVGP